MHQTKPQFSLAVSALGLNLILSVLAASAALGDEPFHKCARCGTECQTCKICRPVEEIKKVSKTEFDCACEDFCVPGRSNLCGVEQGCDECGRVTCKRIWEPTCAQVRSKCVLKKSTVEEEQKVIKWVVEELCPACAHECQQVSPDAPAMPAPAPPTTSTSGEMPWLVDSEAIGLGAANSPAPYFATGTGSAGTTQRQR